MKMNVDLKSDRIANCKTIVLKDKRRTLTKIVFKKQGLKKLNKRSRT